MNNGLKLGLELDEIYTSTMKYYNHLDVILPNSDDVEGKEELNPII